MTRNLYTTCYPTHHHPLIIFTRAILRLGYTGIVSAFDIATTHFTGNHAPYASVEGTFTTQESPGPHCQVKNGLIHLREKASGSTCIPIEWTNDHPSYVVYVVERGSSQGSFGGKFT